MAHGNRGRKPVNALPEELKAEIVIELAGSKYKGFNHTHLTEKLTECEQMSLVAFFGQKSLASRRDCVVPGKDKPPKHRSRRERYPQEGMLLQTDGSSHDWLEGTRT